MANRTAKDAKSIKGTNPQYLVEKIIRTRIYDCKYWKEECFALSSELLVDKALDLDHIGGVYGGNVKPTPFICLVLKMLQIQPSKDIIIEFIKNPDYKYVRALGAVYLRLVGTSLECYNYLEPLYNDYRKLKRKNRNGDFELLHMDELVDELLREERVCDVILPRIQKRTILEQTEKLEPRVSALEEDLSDVESEEEEEEEEEDRLPPSRRRSSRSPTPRQERDRYRHRSRSRSPHRRGRSKSRSPHRSRRRSHSPSRHRHRSSSRSPHRWDSHRHGRKRSSRTPSPHHHRSDRDRERERDRERSSRSDKRDKSSRSKSEKKEGREKKESKKKLSEEDEEIRKANELRAKLGLNPLR